MNARKLILAILALLLVVGAASESFANISNAAVLFLRIAPGSRPAGMGDAFVAIADDATATHWNPAGLGAYPMADSWYEVKLPSARNDKLDSQADMAADSIVVELPAGAGSEYIRAFAPLKSGAGSDYLGYDLWVITRDGLARYDNKRWYFDELFGTRTDQTITKIISSYFNITDDERIAQMAKQVAVVNNKRSFADVKGLSEKIMAAVPADYSLFESLQTMFDSLLTGYDGCLINWEKYREIEKEFTEGMKDSVLSEKEMDRVNFAVENARNRFLPEDLTIPYSIIFTGVPSSITSTEKFLAVGTSNGLVTYDGKRWRFLTVGENLPSNNVTSLFSDGTKVYVGTDRGIASVEGARVTVLADSTILPMTEVSAISGSGPNNLWAVVGSDLYHYDGNIWSNSREYTVVVDDSKEKIAGRFSLYGTAVERDGFIEKIIEVNRTFHQQEVSETVDTVEVTEVPADIDSVWASSFSKNDAPEADSAEVETADTLAVEVAEVEPAVVEEPPAVPIIDFTQPLEPGTKIRVPYLNQFKGEVRSVLVDNRQRVWLGTEYGILMFNGSKWTMPGYRDYTVEEGQSLDDLVNLKTHEDEQEARGYRAVLADINETEAEPLVAGKVVKVYRNPAAVSINDVTGRHGVVYFATEKGLLEFDGSRWRRVDLRGLGRANVVDMASKDDELWFASDEKIIIKANGRTEFAFMHVNWLPELASDLYYEFLSFVSSKEGWGTFGGNVTFITYGSITRTGESGVELGTFEAFDIAGTVSYGTALTDKLAGGVSAKIIYSRLADVGAGQEQGKGTSTGFAVDFGLLYNWTQRMTLGVAVTNIGPKMAYIDAAQADNLPTNLGVGFAYKLLRTDYYQLLVTLEANKLLVGLDDGFNEFKTSEGVILNGGGEFTYANLIALRAGYIYDDEGQVKTLTLGVGLRPISQLRFDFAYIPSNDEVVLANTIRMSIAFLP